jgi:hypothetical protein
VILGFTLVQVAVAVVVGLICVAFGLTRRPPNDVTLIGLALVELLLVAQVVVAIVAPGAGNPPIGNPVEFAVYLITALIIPPLAVFWGLIERSRWSSVVLGVAALAVAVMVYRMQQIWAVQLV